LPGRPSTRQGGRGFFSLPRRRRREPPGSPPAEGPEDLSGGARVLLIGAAVLTVVLSWTVINTVYTLRYADQHFRSTPGGIEFATEGGQQHPSYRDFAYVVFTIGMCYQVSDTTMRDAQLRRTVLAHAILAYVFRVVIVAGSVNLISGLFR
jgi:uncharacterized membrane protein